MRFNDVQDTSKNRAKKKKHHLLTREQVHNNLERMLGHEKRDKAFMFFGVKFSA